MTLTRIGVRWLMVFLSTCAFTLALAIWAMADQPAEVPARNVSLDRLIEEAFRKSPGLQAKQRAYEAAKARVIAAWLPDDPEFGVDVEGQPDLFKFSGRTDNEYILVQTIPFPTTLILRGQLALREAQMAYQRYKEEERNVVWHLEQPYYELYLTKKTMAALREIRALFEKLANTVQARYETNRSSQQDLLKARIELSKVDIELFKTQQDEHLAEAHFSHLLNESLESRYALPEETHSAPLTWSWAELERLALKARPELQAAAIGIQRAKASRWLAKTSWLPDLTGRIEAREFKGGRSERDTFVGVTVPVWSLLKGAGGAWKAADKDVQEADALYTEMKNEVFLAIHEAYGRAKSAEHAVAVYEQFILPQAQQQVEVALAAYEAGRTDFLDLIDAQRMLKDAQLAYYRAQADYERELSNLHLAVGSDLHVIQPSTTNTQGGTS